MKIKLTKGELKRQRDGLRQFEHYLPILQLKKQLLQMEIQHVRERLSLKVEELDNLENEIMDWAGLFNEPGDYISMWIEPKEISTKNVNILGVDVPVFEHIDFESVEYDLFLTPLWVDTAIKSVRQLVIILEEEKILKRQLQILQNELRVTTQRVNLFEKIKIPDAKESVRVIKIYLGDQYTNAVVRSKIAKNKIESLVLV